MMGPHSRLALGNGHCDICRPAIWDEEPDEFEVRNENFAPCRFCNGEGGGMHDTLVGPQWSRCEECNGVGWTPTPHEEGAE